MKSENVGASGLKPSLFSMVLSSKSLGSFLGVPGLMLHL